MPRVATFLLGATLASTTFVGAAADGDGSEPGFRESLEQLAAREPAEAARAARRVLHELDLERSRDASLVWSARRVLARSGDIDLVRIALSSYFDDPVNWRRVLAEAESATEDGRLRDFRRRHRGRGSREEDRLRSRLTWNLEGHVLDDVASDWEPFIRERRESSEVPSPVPSRDPILGSRLVHFVEDLDRDLVERLASSSEAAPDAFAALYRFHGQSAEGFLDLLSDRKAPALVERARFVMSLSGDRRRLPLLVDIAVRDGSRPSREAALNGLAEAELGYFAPRLHRLAGDPERWVRFRAATALVPSGEPWAMRLLVSTIDTTNAGEVYWARRSVERLGRDRARKLLEAVVADGPASPFAVERLLDLCPEAGRLRSSELWALLEEAVERNDPVALLAASRLSNPAARAAVRAYLDNR